MDDDDLVALSRVTSIKHLVELSTVLSSMPLNQPQERQVLQACLKLIGGRAHESGARSLSNSLHSPSDPLGSGGLTPEEKRRLYAQMQLQNGILQAENAALKQYNAALEQQVQQARREANQAIRDQQDKAVELSKYPAGLVDGAQLTTLRQQLVDLRQKTDTLCSNVSALITRTAESTTESTKTLRNNLGGLVHFISEVNKSTRENGLGVELSLPVAINNEVTYHIKGLLNNMGSHLRQMLVEVVPAHSQQDARQFAFCHANLVSCIACEKTPEPDTGDELHCLFETSEHNSQNAMTVCEDCYVKLMMRASHSLWEQSYIVQDKKPPSQMPITEQPLSVEDSNRYSMLCNVAGDDKDQQLEFLRRHPELLEWYTAAILGSPTSDQTLQAPPSPDLFSRSSSEGIGGGRSRSGSAIIESELDRELNSGFRSF